MNKICSKCKQNKLIECFSKCKKNKDGLKYQCKECIKKYNQKNKEKKREYNKQYWLTNKNILSIKNKKYKNKNKEKIKLKRKEYRFINFQKIKKNNQSYLNIKKNNIKIKRKTDKNFQISEILRSKIYKNIKFNKETSYQNIIGLNITMLKKWLEFRFDKNMNWTNFGTYWQIDHIIPISLFDLSNQNEINICFNWKNLQPLESKENRS